VHIGSLYRFSAVKCKNGAPGQGSGDGAPTKKKSLSALFVPWKVVATSALS